jgi:hypothetical protein
MGPAAPTLERAPKAPDPLRAHLLKRTNGPKISESGGKGGSQSPGPVLDPATLAELRPLARSRSRPRSGRQSIAKASAIRTLERLARERRKQPMRPMPEDWYPHQPGYPFYELDWVFLPEHPVILRRHWEMAWHEGQL